MEMIETVNGREKDVTPLVHGKVSSMAKKIDFGSAEVLGLLLNDLRTPFCRQNRKPNCTPSLKLFRLMPSLLNS